MSGRLIIICGLPGAGKTTLARQLAEHHHATRMCPDEVMVARGIDLWDEATRSETEAEQWEDARRLLGEGETVIIEWGLWSKAERDTVRDGARALGAAVELHYLDVSVDVLWKRINTRQLEGRFGARPIRRDELERWFAAFERPDKTELARYDRAT